jgi:hypothetical protein
MYRPGAVSGKLAGRTRGKPFDGDLARDVACAPRPGLHLAVRGAFPSNKRSGETVPNTPHLVPGMSRSLALCAALAVLLLFLSGTAFGQGFCSEPVEPYCVSTDSEFDTLLQVNRCEDDLLDYEQQVTEYEKCISDQINALRQELSNARAKLEEARKNF